MSIAATPVPPYYAVIFTSLRHLQTGAADSSDAVADAGTRAATRSGSDDGYGAMAALMLDSAARQPGFLGVESAREEIGITVSYWDSLQAISNWKRDSEHQLAQQLGRSSWYSAYRVRICRVERDYGFARDAGGAADPGGESDERLSTPPG
ncbi:antibiotic biosynthesis monooxygenase family protein [Massilia sp. PWRC2]|uniref:antibiotic biosynthesis monooxygenase family protein n=1 Tax=Massilia sp. PWRC2 TaxID=2804626 RepID=UPI003CF23DD8